MLKVYLLYDFKFCEVGNEDDPSEVQIEPNTLLITHNILPLLFMSIWQCKMDPAQLTAKVHGVLKHLSRAQNTQVSSETQKLYNCEPL